MKIGTMTQAQLDKFKTAIGWINENGNFRPPQPLNGRVVTGCDNSNSVKKGKYSYPYDADAWGGLCKTGKEQSPIDLPKCQVADTSRKVELTYKVDGGVVLANTGTAIKISVA